MKKLMIILVLIILFISCIKKEEINSNPKVRIKKPFYGEKYKKIYLNEELVGNKKIELEAEYEDEEDGTDLKVIWIINGEKVERDLYTSMLDKDTNKLIVEVYDSKNAKASAEIEIFLNRFDITFKNNNLEITSEPYMKFDAYYSVNDSEFQEIYNEVNILEVNKLKIKIFDFEFQLNIPTPPDIKGDNVVATSTPGWYWEQMFDTEYRIRFNKGKWEEAETNFYFRDEPLLDGEYSIELQIKDEYSNWSKSSVFKTIVDTKIDCEIDNLNEIANKTLFKYTITGTVEDNAIIFFDIPENKPIIDSEGNFNYEIIENVGKGYIKDIAGNKKEIDLNVEINNNIPEIISKQWYTSKVIDIEIKPFIGAIGFEYSLDEENWVKFDSLTYLHLTLLDGSYNLSIRGRDVLENKSKISTVEINVDTKKPDKPLITTNEITTSKKPIWLWNAVDDAEYYIIQLNNSKEILTRELVFSPDNELESNTNHIFYVTAVDIAGNKSNISISEIFIDKGVDYEIENLDLLKNSSGFSFVLKGKAEEGAKFFIDGIEKFKIESGNESFEYEERKNVSQIKIIDLLGNIEIIDMSFTLNNESPKVYSESITGNRNPEWIWESMDSAVRYRCSFNKKDWIYIDKTFYTHHYELSEGAYILYVQAQDRIGGWSNTGSYEIYIDTTKPTKPDINGKEVTNDIPVWFFQLKDDYSQVEYSFDNKTWKQAKENEIKLDEGIIEGEYIIYLRAIDLSKNVSDVSIFSTIYDLTPPEKTVVYGEERTKNRRPSWNWNAVKDSVLYRYSLNESSNWVETDKIYYKSEKDLKLGNNVLYVQSSDLAGNWSESSFFTIEIIQ